MILGLLKRIRQYYIKKRNLYAIRIVMRLIPKTSLRNNQLHFHLFSLYKDIEENRKDKMIEGRD